MKRFALSVGLYSAAHFCVDFACAYLIFYCDMGIADFALCALVYNACAFAMQMPLGVVADGLNRNAVVAAIGCALVMSAVGLVRAPLALAIVAGLGNALFHLGGGLDVLNGSEKKSGALGIFVSPGAFGIYFGTILGKSAALPPWIIVAGLMLVALCVLFICGKGGKRSENVSIHRTEDLGAKDIVALVLLFLVVCLRSFAGMSFAFPWKSQVPWGLVCICAVVFGKALGGFVADAIGIKRAAVVTLGLSGLLFVFSDIPALGVLAVLLFNMSMPMTLWAAAKLLYNLKGFAFGLLTFALFAGFVPAYYGMSSGIGTWGYVAMAIASLLLLFPALVLGRKYLGRDCNG